MSKFYFIYNTKSTINSIQRHLKNLHAIYENVEICM